MGFAGNVEPCFITPTAVAVNESFSDQTRATAKGNWLAQHSAGVMADLDFLIGEEALARSRSSSTYSLSYPIRNGQVDNWDTMEKFWQQCIFNYLRIEKYWESLLYSVVVDVGDGATHIVPVADGYVIGNSISSIPLTGKDVTQFIQQLMKERGEHIPPEESFDVARRAKEMYCYTCSDIVKEFNKHDREPSKYIKRLTGIKPKTGAPYTCDIGYERFLGPEIFFHPEIYNNDFTTPLQDVIDKCIQSSPIDTRRALYKNIVLSGGSTMFKDFHRRLQRDLKKIVDVRVRASNTRLGGDAKAQPVEVNVVSHPIQRYAVWFGGSVLASTAEFYEIELQQQHNNKVFSPKQVWVG
ncbi:unnamed protein product [Triticum turgidum subsp. durum]|uniref:Actin-related protein 3 n=1 Tax=Triticum turgidum subsp. durum TaxID=4567 RepID=A0A9R1BB50_TRITD|nr:unnamed protein product [Triticum turgidum subsp. durum]